MTMCFDGVKPTLLDQNERTARKQHTCCECHLPIRPGERYLATFGVWEGEANRYAQCFVCCWFRDRIVQHEQEAGCASEESMPCFGHLQFALHDLRRDLRDIGMLDLEWYEEGYEPKEVV
jgi:hypothetical protein